jgi:predicted O-methyltransferase YrrM
LKALINISRSLKIAGWMTPEELTWLAQQARKHSRIAEIGSWQGRSTVALAQHTSGRVLAIDTWEGSEEIKHLLEGHSKDWLYETFLANTKGLTNIETMRMPSLQAAGELACSLDTFDMVFIDASHDYENVRADIEAWRPLVEPGGLLAGHDYAPEWPGVMKAVNERFPSISKARALSQQYAPSNWNSNSIWHTVLP